MDCFIMLCSNWYIFFIFSTCNKCTSTYNDSRKNHRYYFSVQGNDKNDGSREHPFKTIGFLNTLDLSPGDSVFLKGGEIFNGNLVLVSTKPGIKKNPIVLTSYGKDNAIVNAANGSAITIDNLSFVNIRNLSCKGSGRKDGNTKSGISISNSNTISVDRVDVSGFQKSGLQLYNCKNVMITYVNAHDNGAAGIGVEGDDTNKLSTRNIYISNCTAVNNPGDPTNLTN
ncbi:MAG TPA: right-handed parallel beta-helix repeat-containing protein, partial [Chitinophagaceae bacterium]|nr:right-handed parallel beta-helix repeat-containing protein [Chitinophagaceae bacterium]